MKILVVGGNGFIGSHLVDALIAASVQDLDADRIFNIGGAEEITLNRLIQYVEEAVGKKAVVNYRPGRKFDVSRLVLSTDRASGALGWHPGVDIREGLKKTWEWMAEAFE